MGTSGPNLPWSIYSTTYRLSRSRSTITGSCAVCLWKTLIRAGVGGRNDDVKVLLTSYTRTPLWTESHKLWSGVFISRSAGSEAASREQRGVCRGSRGLRVCIFQL
ncbi:hypothetical protein LEMLEM_LOCUS13234 [Lemmus lemmus]